MKKLAFVTGTSSGIGLELARALLKMSWTVHGLSRRAADIDDENYTHHSVNLADLKAVEAFVLDWAEKQDWASFERVALINNAASLEPQKPLHRLGLEELNRALTINTTVPSWLMGQFVQFSKGDLVIANLSSGAATSAYPGWGAYCMSKAGLRMASQIQTIEAEEIDDLKSRAIKVIDFAPGVVDTPMQGLIRGKTEKDFPRLEKFIHLHQNNLLHAPKEPANALASLLNTSDFSGLDNLVITRFVGS